MTVWLMKSEPEVFSVDDLKKKGSSGWDGVRNYQARNFMRQMTVGDTVLFYHSNAKPSGIVGVAKVVKTAYPDPTQFDRASDHFDPKAKPDNPIWFQVDVAFSEKFERFLSLDELRGVPGLSDMLLFRRSRLSVQPVSSEHFRIIRALSSPSKKIR